MSVFGNTSRLARIKEYWKGGTTKGEGHVQDIKWLIGQAQLVEDLTKKRKSDAARNALVEEENTRLRFALESIVNIDGYFIDKEFDYETAYRMIDESAREALEGTS